MFENRYYPSELELPENLSENDREKLITLYSYMINSRTIYSKYVRMCDDKKMLKILKLCNRTIEANWFSESDPPVKYEKKFVAGEAICFCRLITHHNFIKANTKFWVFYYDLLKRYNLPDLFV